MVLLFQYINKTDGSKRLKYCGEISTTPKVIGEWNNGKKINRKLVTYNYTAGSTLEFTLYNVVESNQLIKNVELFTSLFNNNRYQFFSNSNWQGNWETHFYHMDRGVAIKLDSSYANYSFTLYIIIDYIET